MKRYCDYCGALLDPNAKICTNCGRVVAVQNPQRNATPRQSSPQGQRRPPQQRPPQNRQRPQNQPPRRPQPQNSQQGQIPPQAVQPRVVYEHPKRVAQQKQLEQQQAFQQENRAAKKIKKSVPEKPKKSHKKLIKNIIVTAVILVIAYFTISFVRIFFVGRSTYDFDTQMKMVSENYSDAMSNYFDDGSWSYNIFKNQVSYSGTKGSEKYVLTFARKNGQTVVDSITIDGNSVNSDKIMETSVMGMFMAQKTTTD